MSLRVEPLRNVVALADAGDLIEPLKYDKRGLMWRKDRILSPAAQAFLRHLESLANPQPSLDAM